MFLCRFFVFRSFSCHRLIGAVAAQSGEALTDSTDDISDVNSMNIFIFRILRPCIRKYDWPYRREPGKRKRGCLTQSPKRAGASREAARTTASGKMRHDIFITCLQAGYSMADQFKPKECPWVAEKQYGKLAAGPGTRRSRVRHVTVGHSCAMHWIGNRFQGKAPGAGSWLRYLSCRQHLHNQPVDAREVRVFSRNLELMRAVPGRGPSGTFSWHQVLTCSILYSSTLEYCPPGLALSAALTV